jgi:hypothetical protein
MIVDKYGLVIQATPNLNCPACIEKRRHTADDWKYHPEAGKGLNNAPKLAGD